MSKHIRLTASHVDKALSKFATENYKLSIQLSTNGFSFSVLEVNRNKLLSVESYQLDKPESISPSVSHESVVLLAIEELFSQFKWIGKKFAALNFIVESNKSTLVPMPLFDPAEINTYLDFSHNITKDEDIISNSMVNLEAFNIFSINKTLREKISSMFPDSTILNISNTLIEGILINHKNQSIKNKVFVNVRNSYFDVIIVDGKRLIFFNTFKYKTKEDFIYFLIFVFEQLRINPEDVELVLLGNIRKNSPLYEMAYNYIRKISFANRSEMIKYSYVFDDVPGHFFYNLLNSNLCGL